MRGVTVGSIICLLVCSGLWLVSSKNRQTDSAIHQPRFARGTKSHYETRQARQSRLPRRSSPSKTDCRYKVALLEFPPYIMNKSSTAERGFMYEKISFFVNYKCFEREKNDREACTMEPIFVQTSEEMIRMIKEKRVDFAFPIQSNNDNEALKDGSVTLIRVFVSSGCSMIVNTKQCEEGSREQLLTSITSQWPILACIILLSGISGVVIWLLEHRTNKAHFPPSFTVGSPEGFWWAVVSLTTVGYGDKIPKSFLGRLFGIIWILVGAIMLSLFTAMATNAMNTSLDGTNCKDIDGKEVGVFMENTETQIVAKEFNAKIVSFSNLEEMQKNLSSGIIGRVLVDRNTAFHFLDKSALKRNRQIRLIRYIDYPMYYYLAHVSKGVLPTPSILPNDTERTNDTETAQRKRQQLAACGPTLKESSTELVGESKETARNQLIPAELQTADLLGQMDGLFSTGSEMTRFILYSLLAVFLVLVFIGIFWEVCSKCNATIPVMRKDMPPRQGGPENGNVIPLNRKMYVMHNLLDFEERLKALTSDLQNLKGEFARTIANQ
ncbi:hypothetical protein ACROYT_G010108 [Oculina patagonica]